jgi:hypothetical protein
MVCNSVADMHAYSGTRLEDNLAAKIIDRNFIIVNLCAAYTVQSSTRHGQLLC